MSQYICHTTSAGRKAGRLFTNTAQSVDRLSTNKADLRNIQQNRIFFKVSAIINIFFQKKLKLSNTIILCFEFLDCPLEFLYIIGENFQECGQTVYEEEIISQQKEQEKNFINLMHKIKKNI